MKNETVRRSVADQIMTVGDVAAYLNCHYSTVYRLLRNRGIPGFRLGGDWRFRREDLDRWISDHHVVPVEHKPKPQQRRAK
jgi:excisionase family DNA binding protein